MKEEKQKCPNKRELQRETRRNEIIEAGLLEFTAQGFTSTLLEDVAKRAGIGKGTIYLYFDSKEKLFEEVVRKNLFPERDKASNFVEDFTGSCTELLTLHLQNMYKYLNEENIPQLLAVVIGEVSRFPILADFFYKEMVNHSKDLLFSIIKKGIESGEFRDVGVESYTQILVAPAILGSIWKTQFDEFVPMDIEDYAKVHIDLILRGLLKDPKQ